MTEINHFERYQSHASKKYSKMCGRIWSGGGGFFFITAIMHQLDFVYNNFRAIIGAEQLLKS